MVSKLKAETGENPVTGKLRLEASRPPRLAKSSSHSLHFINTEI
jgi:hypothetical protein